MPFHIPYYFLYWNLPSVSSHCWVLTKKQLKKREKCHIFVPLYMYQIVTRTMVHVMRNLICAMEEVCWKCAIDIFVWTWELRPRSWSRKTDNKKRTSLSARENRGLNHLIRINSHLIRMTVFFWEEGSGKIYQSNLSGIICRNNLSGIVNSKAASCIFMKRLCWAVDEVCFDDTHSNT